MRPTTQPSVLWEPSRAFRQHTQLARYMRWLTERRGLRFADYHRLWHWSVDDLEGFWSSIAEFFDVRTGAGYHRVLPDDTMPGARWFPGAELNYAEHVFRDKPDHRVAVIAASERGDGGELTWGELRAMTARIAAGLRAQGVKPGDRVAAYLPNLPEAVAALLATASLGATWSSCSPDFGARGVRDRFAQIRPTVLLAVDGYRYNGREFDRMAVVAELARTIPSLRRTVVLGQLATDPALGGVRNGMSWSSFTAGEGEELSFAPVPFDHPLWVLYSSGTTGLPKAIVHGHGGILLEHLKLLNLHFDLRDGDRLFWFTTTGWMMWNVLVSGLLSQAAIVLYDGSPAHPGLEVLWDLAERTGISCFGTSAGYISSCRNAGIEPRAGRKLEPLRSVGSTGSPLAPEGFDWVYERLGPDVWLFSTSGGTDLCTAFVGGVPILPVNRRELQARALGASVEAFDEHGRSLIDETGELVLTKPMPSMPLYLWNDPDGQRYHDSYFSTYPGVWRHGDWIEITSRGTAIIYGRSDSTINRGGIRMGSSEIYRAVLGLPEVEQALVVDVPGRPGFEQGWMPLFVVLRDGVRMSDELAARIKRRIRDETSPRHVPNEIHAVAQVPTTASGKLLEIPVKKILMGIPPEQAASRDTVANPDSLDYFAKLARAL